MKLLITTSILLVLSFTMYSQSQRLHQMQTQSRMALQSNISIQGRVLYTASVQQFTKSMLLSDVKIILIKAGSITVDQPFVIYNRSRICNNDQQIFSRYDPKVTYTDQNGRYQFKNLSPNSNYFLIFCDSKIQMTVVSTSNNTNTSYSIKDKIIYL
jgi:hypothetical protein